MRKTIKSKDIKQIKHTIRYSQFINTLLSVIVKSQAFSIDRDSQNQHNIIHIKLMLPEQESSNYYSLPCDEFLFNQSQTLLSFLRAFITTFIFSQKILLSWQTEILQIVLSFKVMIIFNIKMTATIVTNKIILSLYQALFSFLSSKKNKAPISSKNMIEDMFQHL
ncbi:hypothetical protein TTHERM_000463759 (macronuclear) [Tetrahymena thermophila SB210]|uniref:Uncharacterized protein n=1 Tax=Tetrahymena thermophila (strain SB210) TaxID=312017 RepID=W7XH94_TETTS|nr:hypothetical protein TTHERM_000463759 [Tetrahymena thermophila SB210]EWS73716.1 hypothetical protein TTHERM_000463759 [Tetrahymena thermophila SB210]|eukprot:XP_012653754.1 hypothetical protein TTHERM_000463759 [Tetrahymena thermophila SB210]